MEPLFWSLDIIFLNGVLVHDLKVLNGDVKQTNKQKKREIKALNFAPAVHHVTSQTMGWEPVRLLGNHM